MGEGMEGDVDGEGRVGGVISKSERQNEVGARSMGSVEELNRGWDELAERCVEF